MKPCPECHSYKVYRYKKFVDAAGGYGPDLLPKLASGMFSNAKLLPVICMDCAFDVLGFERLVFSNARGNQRSAASKKKPARVCCTSNPPLLSIPPTLNKKSGN